MKKLFALMLALSLALTMLCAGAETITARVGSYTIDIPDGWARFTADEVSALLLTEQAEIEKQLENLDEQTAANVRAALAQAANDEELFLTPDGCGQLIIQQQDAGGMIPAQLKMMKKQYDRMLTANYMEMGLIADASDAEPLGVVKHGKCLYYGLYLHGAETDMMAYITCSNGGSVALKLAFTGVEREEAEKILASVQFLVN